jgi:hypothetical protein
VAAGALGRAAARSALVNSPAPANGHRASSARSCFTTRDLKRQNCSLREINMTLSMAFVAPARSRSFAFSVLPQSGFMQNGRRCVAAAQVYSGRNHAKDGDGNRPSSASYYMHLLVQRASRCPQEDDLFRPSVAVIFLGVASNPLCAALIWPRFHSDAAMRYMGARAAKMMPPHTAPPSPRIVLARRSATGRPLR